MVKNVVAVEVTVILGLVPASLKVIGPAAYLGPIVATFAHPGRRLGALVESLVVVLLFALLGLSWAILGLYLGSLVYDQNPPAAYAIRGVFLLFAVILHGFLRSHIPRIYVGLVFLLVASLVTLLSPQHSVSLQTATQVLYPVLIALAVNLVANLVIFPETSSDFLGQITIETLEETAMTLRDAETYFIQAEEGLAKPASGDSGVAAIVSTDLDARSMPSHPIIAGEQVHVREKSARWDRWRGTWSKTPVQGRRARAKSESPPAARVVQLRDLSAEKAKLRAQLASCKGAQSECLFELNFSCLPPRDLKPISSASMKKLVANTIALIGACESKYALVAVEGGGDTDDEGSRSNADATDSDAGPSTPGTPRTERESEQDSKKHKSSKKRALAKEKRELELLKPRREIEFGDAQLLNVLVSKISGALTELQHAIDRSVERITVSIAFAYDVKKLPSGAKTPKGLLVEEVDVYVEALEQALLDFDKTSREALEDAAVLNELERQRIDIMPREEIFLISSFILNLRQAATHTLRMLQHCRVLIEQREARRGRKTVYFPHIKWRKWISSGGDESEGHPEDGRAVTGENHRRSRGAEETGENKGDDDVSSDSDEGPMMRGHEDGPPRLPLDVKPKRRKPTDDQPRPSSRRRHRAYKSGKRGFFLPPREVLADALDYLRTSDDVLYTLKLCVAAFLVSFPALVPAWNGWYFEYRGIWAAFQLVYVFEVAIGSTVTAFLVRAAGTITGCLWGWAAYEARNGDRTICGLMIAIGLVPGAYVQLTSKHPKAGQVAMVSMTVVALATELGSTPGSGTDVFLKRISAFLIGSTVGLVLQVVLFPVKARTRLVESLALSIHHISQMEACIALGIETGADLHEDVWSASKRFERESAKAHNSLAAAEVFLPFCLTEPRLKGSFAALHLWYSEILFVLHQITDRMDNMLFLRRAYGSSVLEDFNPQIYRYRRNVAGAITCILFAVHEALTTKLPLPQFLPSARLAYLRMINRVREVVETSGHAQESDELHGVNVARRRAVRQKFIAWNASSAAQAEVVEYLEELTDLVKILVGVHEFRDSVLGPPRMDGNVQTHGNETGKGDEDGGRDILKKKTSATESNAAAVARRRAYTASKDDEGVPEMLKRMQSRRVEAASGRSGNEHH